MTDKLLNALNSLIKSENDKNITVALSGGGDSVALLYGLLMIKDKLSLNISAAHLNHLLRGEESERDEAFVRKLCKDLNVKLTVKRVDIAKLSKQTKQGIELTARKERYAFLSEVNTGVVATAHTASDNTETVMLHLSRGSGLAGLCGIPARRDIFIRPLLGCSEDEIKAFISQHNLSFVTDSSNLSDHYSRNFLRHRVIPLIKTLNPSIDAATKRMCESLTEDRDFTQSVALKEYENRRLGDTLNCEGFDSLHKAIAKRVIRLYIEGFNVSADYELTTSAYNTVTGATRGFSLPDKTVFHLENNILTPKKTEKINFSVTLEKTDLPLKENNKKIHNLLLTNSIDCDKIVGDLEIRTKKAGDSITLSRRGVTKSLKKLFSEDKIPLSLRESIPVIADNNGVVWVYGYGQDRRVKPNEKTKTVYTVICKKD